MSTVSEAIGRQLSWQQDDIALQNIQARVRELRASGCWPICGTPCCCPPAIAAKRRSAMRPWTGIPAAGCHRSPASTRLSSANGCVWMETIGPDGIGPVPALRTAVNRQQPTAELRPHEAGQTDEDDLMPYDDAGRNRAGGDPRQAVPLEVYRRMQGPGGSLLQPAVGVVGRTVLPALVPQPVEAGTLRTVFHLDDENLDPKTWCRFPILSGGYQRELRQLRAFIDKQGGFPAACRFSRSNGTSTLISLCRTV